MVLIWICEYCVQYKVNKILKNFINEIPENDKWSQGSQIWIFCVNGNIAASRWWKFFLLLFCIGFDLSHQDDHEKWTWIYIYISSEVELSSSILDDIKLYANAKSKGGIDSLIHLFYTEETGMLFGEMWHERKSRMLMEWNYQRHIATYIDQLQVSWQ